MRTCIKCRETKEITEFHKNSGLKGNVNSKCKICVSAYAKAYYDGLGGGKARLRAKKYRELNPSKAKEYSSNNKDRANSWSREYRRENLAKVRARESVGRERNREARRESGRKHYMNNSDAIKAKVIEYRGSNQEAVRATRLRVKGARRQRIRLNPSELDLFVIQEAANLLETRERVMGGKWHVDHIEPLLGVTVSGLHNAYNLAVVPATYNLRKSNRQVSEPWYRVC